MRFTAGQPVSGAPEPLRPVLSSLAERAETAGVVSEVLSVDGVPSVVPATLTNLPAKVPLRRALVMHRPIDEATVSWNATEPGVALALVGASATGARGLPATRSWLDGFLQRGTSFSTACWATRDLAAGLRLVVGKAPTALLAAAEAVARRVRVISFTAALVLAGLRVFLPFRKGRQGEENERPVRSAHAAQGEPRVHQERVAGRSLPRRATLQAPGQLPEHEQAGREDRRGDDRRRTRGVVRRALRQRGHDAHRRDGTTCSSWPRSGDARRPSRGRAGRRSSAASSACRCRAGADDDPVVRVTGSIASLGEELGKLKDVALEVAKKEPPPLPVPEPLGPRLEKLTEAVLWGAQAARSSDVGPELDAIAQALEQLGQAWAQPPPLRDELGPSLEKLSQALMTIADRSQAPAATPDLAPLLEKLAAVAPGQVESGLREDVAHQMMLIQERPQELLTDARAALQGDSDGRVKATLVWQHAKEAMELLEALPVRGRKPRAR